MQAIIITVFYAEKTVNIKNQNLHLHRRGSLFGQCVSFIYTSRCMKRDVIASSHIQRTPHFDHHPVKKHSLQNSQTSERCSKNLYICTPNHSSSSLIRLVWFLFAYLNQSPTWHWLGICSGLRRAKGACMCVFLIVLLCVSCGSKVSTDNDEARGKAGKSSTGQGCRNTVE